MFANVGFRTLRTSRGSIYGMFVILLLGVLIANFAGHLLIDSESNISRIIGSCSQVINFSKRTFYSSAKDGYQSNGSNGDGYSANAQTGPFTYKTAVAFQPKDRDDQIYQKLKESIKSPTGEDNYFTTSNNIHDIFAGVADGVGGWAEHGYDSSAISRELCKKMGELSTTLAEDSSKETLLTPKNIIDAAYAKIKDDKIVKVGGTTAIMAHFPPSGKLQVANLGDSWCGVFRDSKLVFQTEFQTVGFNAPYQLSIIPEKMLKEAERKGSKYILNTPADADEYTFQLEKNDIVMLATDGVTDNIATDDIELFLKDNSARTRDELQLLTQELVKNVVSLSKDPNYPSVFAQEISKLTGRNYSGGKEDDITVVVVRVD
ncbi:type 2C protein phosphatase PTC7 [Saccharomyces eubayanus]|uniref:type 2C protein phosphatase PTC7 n=1 Tax=Saccharomyces eubayanus TaxID=1080349 RepID=UPI0006C4F0A5|nr:PTC7-like protein [Saccharomyces eubayanus]KOG99141.1 PTC7-like protein [Saccharomyces eubayanus]